MGKKPKDDPLTNKASSQEQAEWFKAMDELRDDFDKVQDGLIETLQRIERWIKGEPIYRPNGECCIYPHGTDLVKSWIRQHTK